MSKFFIFLLFLQFTSQVYGDCEFKENETKDERRIVAVNKNGVLEPLNEQKVAGGTKLYYICTNDDVIEVECQTNGEFNRNLPVSNCEKPMAAIVQAVQDSSCKATMYRIGYEYSAGFLELYRSCYDAAKMRAHFSIYTAKPFTLPTSRPGNRFTTDDILSNADAETFKPQNVLQRFKDLFGEDQKYASSDLNKILINRGHMAPSGDFLFFSNSRATFKLVNIMPQFNTINGGNWRKIEDWVKQQVVANGQHTVKTGAIGLLKLPKAGTSDLISVYLAANERNPVPKWNYKIINGPQISIVFLVYNNVFNQQAPDVSQLCQVKDCPVATKKRKEFGFTFCCDVQHFENNVLK